MFHFSPNDRSSRRQVLLQEASLGEAAVRGALHSLSNPRETAMKYHIENWLSPIGQLPK